MKGFAQSLQKFSHSLSLFEWLVIIIIPAVLIGTIRILPMFYIGLIVLSVVSLYLAVAAWDYKHTKYKKQRTQKARHYSLTALYILGGLMASIVYLMG